MGEFFSWLPTFGWILIPITAILVGAFKEWLKFREKAQRLDASSEEVVKAIAALRDDRDELRRRIEQLESLQMSNAAGQSHVQASRRASEPTAKANELDNVPELLELPDEDTFEQTRSRSRDRA